MTLRYSEKVRNAGIDARIAAIGPSPTLQIFDRAGKRLAVIKLPRDWMNQAERGVAKKRGIWTGVAEAEGEPARFDIRDAADAAHMSGDIPADMRFDAPKFEKGQNVVVGNFAITAGNAG